MQYMRDLVGRYIYGTNSTMGLRLDQQEMGVVGECDRGLYEVFLRVYEVFYEG